MSNLNFVVQNKRGKACVADDISGVLLSDETVPPNPQTSGTRRKDYNKTLICFLCLSSYQNTG